MHTMFRHLKGEKIHNKYFAVRQEQKYPAAKQLDIKDEKYYICSRAFYYMPDSRCSQSKGCGTRYPNVMMQICSLSLFPFMWNTKVPPPIFIPGQNTNAVFSELYAGARSNISFRAQEQEI